MKKWMFLLLMPFGLLFAVLSPMEQNVKELSAVLNSSQVKELIGNGDVISEILHKERQYIIVTKNNKLIAVDVEYLPSKGKRARPVQFALKPFLLEKVNN